MASRQNYQRTSNRVSSTRQSYVYGNVVTKPVYEPRRHTPEPRRKVSTRTRVARRKALQRDRRFVAFLATAAVLALVMCVGYVRLQSRITSTSKEITAMQQQLTDLREQNNTRYNAVMDSVNLEEVSKIAHKKLGMVYASPNQIVEYQAPAMDSVEQFESIPKNGVLAQSDKN